MDRIKCECGHVNPEGTLLCESCGKPIEESNRVEAEKKRKLLNMRYDGSARRSQTYNRSIIDKIWSFFSSVKVGIWLIVITLIASSIGTIYPQSMHIPADAPSRDPAIFYEDRYGIFGKIYYQLGFHELYTSWWYIILIALIGISLVICSLDRVIPLYRALKLQKPKRHKNFMLGQRFYSETENFEGKDLFVKRLKKQGYKVEEQDGHVLLEKGRFSRWGPYVNHIGLIIILFATVLRFMPFMFTDASVSVREGETIRIPGTNGEYYIKNKQFIFEEYDEEDERFKEAIEKSGNVVHNYQTDATIYRAKDSEVVGDDVELEEVLDGEVRMNQPLKFDGYALYQRFYDLNEFKDMSFKLYRTDDPEQKAIDTFTIDLSAPEPVYELKDGFKVELDDYWPDYYLDAEDEQPRPRSDSTYPKNPAFLFFVYPPEEEQPEISFAAIRLNIDPTNENEYKLAMVDANTRHISTLTVRKDRTLPFYVVGASIFMIGVIQGMYWQHRRIWLHPSSDGKLLLAAHTNKNWHGLKRDIEKALDGIEINMVEDRQELTED